MSQIPSISDALRTVVGATEAAIIANPNIVWGTLPKKVYFMQGSLLEITGVLDTYTKSPTYKDKKYPLVCFIRDVKETITQQISGLGTSFKCRILIVTLTSQDLRADDRELKNFKPILIPIFEELIRQFEKSTLFGMPRVSDLAITKYDCYFYGTAQNNKNIFNDRVDAIDIESISLNLKNHC